MGILDYGVIGDGRSCALISREGSVDWLCWPRFDSSSFFAKILDSDKGGYWKISPRKFQKIHRQYIEETNVLKTEFITESGSVFLTDFMPAISEDEKGKRLLPENELIRSLETEVDIDIDVEFDPRPKYGLFKPKIRECLGFCIQVGRYLFRLRSSSQNLSLKAGERIHFSLSCSTEGPAVIPDLSHEQVDYKLSKTIEWWQNWAKRAEYNGPYRKEVIRSALALKLLGYAPSGTFVAAATTSLPERLGGPLNWDYRFCWLRDTSWAVKALLGLGYREEAEAFVSWMLHSTRLTLPELKIVYDVYGRKMEREKKLDYLAGFENSRPVHVGNATRDQFQLDVYGEVIDGIAYFVGKGGKLDRETQKMVRHIGKYICDHWRKKGCGIWEEGDAIDYYTHSHTLAWAALDNLIKMEKECGLSRKEIEKFEINRDLIRKEIEEQAWNDDLKSYVRTLNGSELDATLLTMVTLGFDDPSSFRMQETYKKVQEKLSVKCLLYRFEKSYRLQEGAFLLCNFWKIDFLTKAGNLNEAHDCFRKTLTYANDLGLFSEEADPVTGTQLGNFPQAFTHLGLILSALLLEKTKG